MSSSGTGGNSGGVESGLVAGEGFRGYLLAVYKFIRPHTVRGTILASVCGVARALGELTTPLAMMPWLELLPNAIKGLMALILGNAFIVGINQIYDVDIDRVNKPFLPVAADELSGKQAWVLVLLGGIAGPLLVSSTFSPLITKLYAFGLFIGGIYSVPPLRLKRFPLAAGLTIATVRGFLLNFGVYYAAREALGMPFLWSPGVAFLACFMTVFAGTIAVAKDLPDIDGDALFGVETFSTRLGVKRIAELVTGALCLNYAAAIAAALVAPAGTFRTAVMVPGHALLAAWLLRSHAKLEPESQTSVKAFYKRIWDLFYLEYFMYPFL